MVGEFCKKLRDLAINLFAARKFEKIIEKIIRYLFFLSTGAFSNQH